MTKRPLRICLIMHATRSDNLGVGALSVSEVEIIRDIAREIGHAIEITIMDWKDAREPYISGPDITVIDLDGKMMRSPKGYFAIARRSDLVIDIGGGDSFASGLIYGFLSANDPQVAVEYGAAHGALAMTTPGDTTMATLAEVEKIVGGGGARVDR